MLDAIERVLKSEIYRTGRINSATDLNWITDVEEVERRNIPSCDTFNISYNDESLPKLISADIERNQHSKQLRYHVSAAQSSDLSLLIETIKKQEDRLKDFKIMVVASTILRSSRSRINLDYCDSYRYYHLPGYKINLQTILMDNDNPQHRERFESEYHHFDGTMFNVGGAKFSSPKEIAEMFFSTTQESGWVQSGYVPVINELIFLAERLRGKDRIVSESLAAFSTANPKPITVYMEEQFHYVIK